MLADLDLHSITDDRARQGVQPLRNLLEDVRADWRAAQADIQRLHDEIPRLQGAQGRPQIPSNTPPPPAQDHASEQERHTPKTWSKGRKTDRIPRDRGQVGQVEPTPLPPDALCKGDEDVVGQDGLFRTDPILFQKEKGDAPSQPRTSRASFPQG